MKLSTLSAGPRLSALKHTRTMLTAQCACLNNHRVAAVLQGKPVVELRRALDAVSTEELLDAAADQGLVSEAVAENATSISPKVVAELVIAGLEEPQGTPCADAPAPPGEWLARVESRLLLLLLLVVQLCGCCCCC
jgi:hypothetical protein